MKVALGIAAMLCGCTLYGGDGVDPPPDDPPDVIDGVLPAATSMLTGVYAVATDADAKVWVVVRDDATGDAVLVAQDVRFDGTEEVDRMPFGEGTPQIVLGQMGIVWGFGGVASAGGTFRYVTGNGAQDIDFGARTPNVVLGQHADGVLYASTGACTTENLDLTSGAVDVRPGSCFAQFESVVPDEILGIWLRIADDTGTSIGMMDGLWFGEVSYAKVGMDDPVGPFVSPNTYWFIDNADEARVYTGATHVWPVPAPTELAHLPGIVVDAGAIAGDSQLWGASIGDPTYLYPIDPAGLTIRYPVSYQPSTILGLHDRLIVLLDDGRLLSQPLP